MSVVKQILYLMCTMIFLTLFIPFINKGNFQVIDSLNFLFIIALIFVLVGCVFILLNSSMIVRFVHFTNYFFRKISNRRNEADKVERKKLVNRGKDIKEKVVPKWVRAVIVSGVLMASISMVLSFIVIRS